MTTDRPPANGSTPKPAGRLWPVLALALVLGVHVYGAVGLYPSPGSIVDPATPVVVVDHAIHEYHGSLGARFFREAGTTWGYDPFFMAGYPETPVWDSSSNPAILFDLIGGGGGYRSYKVGLLTCSILLLAAVSGGAWAAGLGPWEVAAGTGLAWFSFWAGMANPLWRSGLFAFVSASGGVGLLLGLCVRFDRRPDRTGWAALAATGAGLFYFHITAPILAAGGALAFHATVARRHGWPWHAAILAAAAVAALANGPWLIALWRFRGIRTSSGLFLTADSAWYLLAHLGEKSIEGRADLLLVILGMGGLLAWLATGRRAAAAAFGGSILALMGLTAFGSLWGPTRSLEPVRFQVAFGLLLAVPAGSAVAGLSGALSRRSGGGGRGALAVGLAWAATLGAWAAAEWPVVRATARRLAERRPLVVGVTPEMRGLVEWIRANTDASARILFEDQLRLLEATDPESVHWTPLLPALLRPDDRMFVGGLYQTAFIQHHEMAAFGDFRLGDLPIDEWSPAGVRRYCDTYNVGWVVCWSPLSRFWFDRFPAAQRVATLPRYSTATLPVSTNEHEWSAMIRRAGIDVARRYMKEGEKTCAVYRLDRPHTYFLKGKGRIVAFGPNRVELAEVEPEGGAVVLGLHWLETWKTDPPLRLHPEPTPPDPVDFVRIELAGPTPRIVLFNGYGRR